MKTILLTIPLWEKDVHLMVGGDWNDILKLATKLKLSEEVLREIKKDHIQATDCGAAYFCLINGVGILWFPRKRVKYSVLGHEATHIVDEMLKYIGAETESEARAYSVEWLEERIPELLKKM